MLTGGGLSDASHGTTHGVDDEPENSSAGGASWPVGSDLVTLDCCRWPQIVENHLTRYLFITYGSLFEKAPENSIDEGSICYNRLATGLGH